LTPDIVLLTPEAMQMGSKLIRLADEKQVVYFAEEQVYIKNTKDIGRTAITSYLIVGYH